MYIKERNWQSSIQKLYNTVNQCSFAERVVVSMVHSEDVDTRPMLLTVCTTCMKTFHGTTENGT